MTKQELEQCIEEYGRDIYSFCRYLTNDLPEAEDLYQDTFLLATEVKERIEYNRNPKSYLLSIALRIWKNKKRKYAWRKRIADVRPAADALEADSGGTAELSLEEQILATEKDESVRIAVSHLPEKLKIVVLLFYMEELTTAQIAEVIKIPVGTVLSRLHEARKRLKKELEDVL